MSTATRPLCQDSCRLAIFCLALILGSVSWSWADDSTLYEISGTVTDRIDDSPLEGVLVSIQESRGERYTTTTDGSGSYRFDVPVGFYGAWTTPEGYQGEKYDDIPCSEHDCDRSGGILLSTDDAPHRGIDFALDPLSKILGRVTSAGTEAEGIEGATLVVGNPALDVVTTATTQSDGSYEIPLPAGDYYLAVYAPGFRSEAYDNVPCDYFQTTYFTCPPEELETLSFTDLNQTLTDIDFALEPAGSISGRITDSATEQGLASVQLAFTEVDGDDRGFAITDENGVYRSTGLIGSAYYVEVIYYFPYIPEIYDDLTCYLDKYSVVCPRDLATPVTVEPLTETPEVDFQLDKGGSISGTVTDSLSGLPIQRAFIDLFREDGTFVAVRTTDEQGRYVFEGLWDGDYRLRVFSSGHVGELYRDIPCLDESPCHLKLGDSVRVERQAETSGIDIALDPLREISGLLTDRQSGIGVPHPKVVLFDDSGELVSEKLGNADGSYRFDGLPPGEYYLVAGGESTVGHVYGAGDCDDCDPLSGTPIRLGSDPDTAVVSLDLQAAQCLFPGLDLCLGDAGRFRTMVRWQNTAGDQGFATSWGLTSDSGVFSFFDGDNIEGIVKVLDACVGPSHRYWVFAAGLTDVQTTLWVTDLQSRETLVYENPQGQAFLPIQDTQGFDTCNLAGFGEESDSRFQTPDPWGLNGLSVTPATKNCPGSSGELCLNGGRFSVRAFYRAGGGPELAAGAMDLTDDSGYFWFFDEANVEVLIKVLDACRFSDRFWVFAAGLTDVEVRLEVTDTETGEIRTYTNNQGDAFQPIQDTQAFDVCF